MILNDSSGTIIHIKSSHLHTNVQNENKVSFIDEDENWYIPYIHREDGPAIIHSDGKYEWYLNGHKFSKPEEMPHFLFVEYCKHNIK